MATGPQLSRLLRALRLHGLIKNVGRTSKYYLTELGRRVTTAALKLRNLVIIPALAQPLDALCLRNEALTMTAMLARLSVEDEAKLMVPLYPSSEHQVALMRDASFSALDPIEAAIGSIAAGISRRPRRGRLPAVRGWQGHRCCRSQARLPHPQRRRGPIRQLCRWLGRAVADLAPAACLPVRIHRREYPVHPLDRTPCPQPRPFLIPPPGPDRRRANSSSRR